MRLACDEMLQGLARWLRAAGHDTLVAERGMSDRALLALCEAEGRTLISRDRKLLQIRRRPPVVILTTDDLETQARALSAVLGLDWRLAPFTRCLEDNALLRPATPDEVARMPASARDLPGPWRACPVCGRVYWPGSHVRRMQARLDRFAQAELQPTEAPGMRT